MILSVPKETSQILKQKMSAGRITQLNKGLPLICSSHAIVVPPCVLAAALRPDYLWHPVCFPEKSFRFITMYFSMPNGNNQAVK
jgi:hypothetical protein